MSDEAILDQRRKAKRAAAARARRLRERNAVAVTGDEQGVKARPEKALLVKQDAKGRYAGHKGLSEKGEALAQHLANGVPVGMAGRLAGYSDVDSSASRARRTPAVAARVLDLMRARFQRGVPAAIRLMEHIVMGKISAPPGVRVDCAKTYLAAAEIIGTTRANKDNETKDLRTMSLEELERLAALFRDKERQAIAPHRPGDDAQVIDIIDEGTT